jgi:hypothetical protein
MLARYLREDKGCKVPQFLTVKGVKLELVSGQQQKHTIASRTQGSANASNPAHWYRLTIVDSQARLS